MNRRDFLRSSLVLPVTSSAALGISLPREQRQVQGKAVGLNPRITGIKCLRCQRIYPVSSGVADSGHGCPDCLAQGYPVNVTFCYGAIDERDLRGRGKGMLR